jgi:hypothetical protein
MRRIEFIRNILKGLPRLHGRGWMVLGLPVAVWFHATAAAAADKIPILPEAAYDRFIIYECLAVFWIFIIGLIVIIRMKLKEIERTQALCIDREDKDAPFLD